MKFFILSMLLILNYACNGQIGAQMERFDIANFKKKAIKGENVYITGDTIKVRQWQLSKDVFVQETSVINSTEMLYQEFYSDSGFLKLSGKTFHGFPIGIWKEFANNGALTKEIDKDKGYEFSINDLDKKMKALKVNIRFEQTGVTVMRADAGRPKYLVNYPVSDDSPFEVYRVMIDGITGETLSQEIVKIRH